MTTLRAESGDLTETAPTVVPLRHPGRIAAAVVLALIVAQVAYVLCTNDRFGWDVVRHYLFAGRVLRGVWLSVWLTVVSMVAGLVLGVVLAVMRLSANPVARWTSWVYVWLFRSTPVLVQLVFWYNLSALFPRVGLSVPFGGPEIWTTSANSAITPLTAAILGLALNEAAYMAEIIRSGILSVDAGQAEAATAFGMTRLKALRRVILPQAMRVIAPPTGNELITMLKTTALVSTVAVSDLMYTVQQISAANFEVIPLLIAASLWYLALVSVLMLGQAQLERRLNRSLVRTVRVRTPRRRRSVPTLTRGSEHV
ncbi:amino acid ABC transporter permease [Nocardioides sp. BP30]|uniref:amino acid ABC transporter permease n=1 Tax=Nocardioides sp. BP30 TaxID=3036374 RepID=UPI00246986CF|nr:amino acid ABC transporter permease [Nocardioides sp. BP30]WGL52805.1 amino acid ABC transporter permease [Nocardioides sp. BP30]